MACLFLLIAFSRFTGSTEFVPDSRYGSVFGLLVYEQMGAAATDVMNLQCWAGSLKMKVVEPSIREKAILGDQVFHFSSDPSREQFRELIDIDHWNSYAQKKNYAPLVSLEEFIDKASRNIIYVEMMYSGYLKCPQGPFHYVSNIFASPLEFGFRRAEYAVLYPYRFLSSHGFKIVRKVCIDLLQEGRLRTQQEFNELVFGDLLGKGNFTVIFDEWRAFRNESEEEGKLENVDPKSDWHQILVKDSLCTFGSLKIDAYHNFFRAQKVASHKSSPVVDIDTAALKSGLLGLIPSSQVLGHAAEYRAKYLNNKPYVAIMLRMESLQEGIKDALVYKKCIEAVKSFLKYSKANYQTDQTFLTSDLGKYGSYTIQQYDLTLSEKFQNDLAAAIGLDSLKDSVTKRLEAVTQSEGRVRIAWTQGIIVAEARCTIFLGGGAFQNLVLNLHTGLYKENECFVFLDKNCVEFGKAGFSSQSA